jgi:hypothetical protein
LLDTTGELANGRFHPAETRDEIGHGHLCVRIGGQHTANGTYNQE